VTGKIRARDFRVATVGGKLNNALFRTLTTYVFQGFRMSLHKIKIAARLRPRLQNELDDEGIQIAQAPDGPSCISVANPRDVSQVFNFP
jgi:hypothetical protein